MHNTDISIQESTVPGSPESPLSYAPERPETSVTSEYYVSVFRDNGTAVDEASNIVCSIDIPRRS